MNISTRAIHVPLTLLLVLSFLVQALPLHVFAQEAASEPSAETPAPAEVLPETAPETVANPVTRTEQVDEPFIPTELEVDNSDIVEVQFEPIVEDLEAPVFRMEATDTPTYLSLSGTVDLPNGCITEDVSGQTFVFPTATTTEYLAVCALVEALDEEVISDVELTSSSFGLYVSSINGIPAGTNEYWAIWINDGYANCGVSCQTLSAGDEIAFVRTAYDPVTYAETPLDRVELTITSLEDTYDNIIVPDACAVTDVSGVAHTYPQGDSLLGVCGLVAAVSEGYVSGYELTDSSFGLFISSLDGIPAGTNEYWAIWINDGYANCGVSCQTLSAGDEIAFVRTAYDPVTYAETEHERVALRVIGSVHVAPPTEEEDGGSTGGTGDDETLDSFSVSSAFSFLATAQESDGSIENDLVTDWSAIAFATGGAPANAKTLLKNYLKNEEVDMDTASDYIRHAMAMLALDLNPYSAGPEDYITPIVESFDGTQVGEDQYINDDIFALFPLTHAGYGEDDQLIKDIVSFVLSQQQGDGSWVGGTDMTAAAVQALEPLSSLPGVPDALTRAETYLRSKQESDGGFGDVFATTWTILAINALGEDPASWKVGSNDPLTYLAALQEEDGSVSTSSGTRSDAAWATAYAIPAVKGTTWHELLDTVRKQEPSTDSKDEEKSASPAGEVLGAEDSIVPEPLLPAFTFAVPSEESASTFEPRVAPTTEVASNIEDVPETPGELVASVAEAEGSSWLMGAISSFWKGILDFFRSFFS